MAFVSVYSMYVCHFVHKPINALKTLHFHKFKEFLMRLTFLLLDCCVHCHMHFSFFDDRPSIRWIAIFYGWVFVLTLYAIGVSVSKNAKRKTQIVFRPRFGCIEYTSLMCFNSYRKTTRVFLFVRNFFSDIFFFASKMLANQSCWILVVLSCAMCIRPSVKRKEKTARERFYFLFLPTTKLCCCCIFCNHQIA